MKTKILLLLVLIANAVSAQDTLVKETRRMYLNTYATEKRTHIFSVSPMSRKTAEVDGLVLGFGHIDNKLVEKQTINGLNVEVNPAPIVGAFVFLMGVMYLPESLRKANKGVVADSLNQNKKPDFEIPSWKKTPLLKLNGINLSTGCFFTPTNMNGLNISFANKFETFNGLSITPLGILAGRQNGISLGLINGTNELNGLAIGGYNQTIKLDGLQIGLVNQSIKNHGVQIGIFNRSYSKGFQLGIWNKNSKRTLPIFNW